MLNRTTLLLIAATFFAVAAPSAKTAEASSADACTLNGGSIYAECMGSYSVHTSEDYSTSTGCMGACGPGCSYNCDGDGPGGACYEHDLATRTYGMFSSQAMSKFPPALRKWASCETGRYVTTPTTSIFSRVTSAVRSGWNKLSGLAW
ncbi:MAG: hypothetical protein ABI467_00185 [Kofleriaceae bacterium]